MKQVKITGTELVSSTIALGGVPLGSQLNEAESFALMDAYIDKGGNMVDTAEVYANWLPGEKSISEITIGKWMKARNNRNSLVVTTKGGHPVMSTMEIGRLAPEEIAEDVEGSLRRLQVDTIDLYWLHRDDRKRSAGEIIETLNKLVKEGKIRYFGCSNWSADRIEEAQSYAASHQLQGFSANQPMWSLATIDLSTCWDPTLAAMDNAMLKLHLETGLTAIPYSSQAQGIFTKLAEGRIAFEDISSIYQSEANRIKLDKVVKLSAEKGITISQVVLAYILSHPFVSIPIIGSHTIKQLEDSLKADEVRLTADELAYLNS